MEWEFDQLADADMQYQAHEPDEAGIIRVDVVHTVDDVDYEFAARFPVLYPYFRPVVTTSHQIGRAHV